MAKKKKKSLDQLVNEVEERKRAGAKKRIVSESWKKYTDSVRSLSEKASQELNDYILDGHTDKDIIDFAYALINKYGEASSELACEMYEALAAVSNAMVPPAEPAEVATYDEVTRAVKGTMAKTHDANVISSAAGRLVKMANVDTMLKNGLRDGAEWAWIPQGDTCAFCLALASRGWQKASEEAIKNGHAAHIHNNCDCNYVVRHSPDVEVEGYDPEALYEQYMNAEGDTSKDKINSLRRQDYSNNRELYRARKRINYARKTGALYGAYNDQNDPYFRKRDKIARDLYTEISNRKRNYEIEAVAKNTGFSKEEIDTVFAHVFEKEHLFEDGRIGKFDPDYYMAQSWLRLREGKNIQEHDLVLLHHELEEARIMNKNLEIPYEKAHNEVEKTWNYKKALTEYLKTHEA